MKYSVSAIFVSFYRFKGAICNVISLRDVIVLSCAYTKTNWLPADPQKCISLQMRVCFFL